MMFTYQELAAACRANDAISDGGGDFQDAADSIGFDVEAVVQAANQRALRLVCIVDDIPLPTTRQPVPLTKDQELACSAFASSWVDGFATAMRAIHIKETEADDGAFHACPTCGIGTIRDDGQFPTECERCAGV